MAIIGITGSEGLIGTALAQALVDRGDAVRRLDVCLPIGHAGSGDVRIRDSVRRLVAGCDGVVHLAAVSRVLLGERDPTLCWDTNVLGTQEVIDACLAQAHRPWLLFSSSREVYGQVDQLPVTEDTALRPLNIYGRSKAEAEARVFAARGLGLGTAVLRFSNVYGSTHDHADRVVPAFARAALWGGLLRVDGSSHVFDFTHLADTVRGILATIDRLACGVVLPPIQLVTGQGTTLSQLADLAQKTGGGRCRVVEAPARSYDVTQFVGSPQRARELLGFAATTSIAQGMAALIAAFRALSPKEKAGAGFGPLTAQAE